MEYTSRQKGNNFKFDDDLNSESLMEKASIGSKGMISLDGLDDSDLQN
jgi:hypothetical protein